MNIKTFASGSRGDVQPYVALGRGLQAAGHHVTVLGASDFETRVTGHGLDFIATSESLEACAQQLQVEGGNMVKILAAQAKAAQALARRAATEGLGACRDADLILGGLGGIFGSMASREPRATADMALEALRRTGQRGVLYSGWGGLHKENLPDNVFMVGSTPHTWLF